MFLSGFLVMWVFMEMRLQIDRAAKEAFEEEPIDDLFRPKILDCQTYIKFGRKNQMKLS